MKLTTLNSDSAPAVISREERAARCFELRKAGLNYSQIAERIEDEWGERGIAHQLPSSWGKRYAHADVTVMMQRNRETIQDTILEVLELEIERLDQMMAAIWDRAINGHLESIDRILKIMDRRSRLLGLDKNVEQDWRSEIVTLLQTGQITLEQVRKELGDELAATIVEYASVASNDSGAPKGTIKIELGSSSSDEL